MLGLASYMHGGHGGIFAGASLAPRQCVEVYDAFVSGDLATAVRLQRQATRLTQMARFGATSAVVKIGLERLGICDALETAPLGLVEDAGVVACILLLDG